MELFSHGLSKEKSNCAWLRMNLPDKKIIKIEPTNQLFTVNWNIGLRCNFDCMYCPSTFHNATDKDLGLLDLQNHWKKIVEKTKHTKLKFRLAFTGGEVSVNKNFLFFLHWLNDNYKDKIAECGYTTNGSGSKKFYLDSISIDIISFISFSTHSEFFNEQKFFNTVLEVNKKRKELVLKKNLNKRVNVNIMDEYWNQEKIKIYKDFLTKKGIDNNITKIFYEAKTRDTVRLNPNKQNFNFNEN